MSDESCQVLAVYELLTWILTCQA